MPFSHMQQKKIVRASIKWSALPTINPSTVGRWWQHFHVGKKHSSLKRAADNWINSTAKKSHSHVEVECSFVTSLGEASDAPTASTNNNDDLQQRFELTTFSNPILLHHRKVSLHTAHQLWASLCWAPFKASKRANSDFVHKLWITTSHHHFEPRRVYFCCCEFDFASTPTIADEKKTFSCLIASQYCLLS